MENDCASRSRGHGDVSLIPLIRICDVYTSVNRAQHRSAFIYQYPDT